MKPDRATSCDGKVRMTAPHAKRAARNIRERGDDVRLYACSYCGHWHVGSFYKPTSGRVRRKFSQGVDATASVG